MKTQSQHTPGPWETDDHNETIGIIPSNISAEDFEASDSIADVDRRYKNASANARLIASAPELLEAAKRLLIDLERPFFRMDKGAVDSMKSAIAKAEGR